MFTRDITKVKGGRCSYQFPCYDDGGMITDGILIRLASDRFWYVQADGDLFSWLKAHTRGLDVKVVDPDVWVSQVQGPASLELLRATVDDEYPDPFRYFDVAEVRIAGQNVTLSRSGFTNELGWEFYLEPGVDAPAVGDRILEAGEPYGLVPVSSEASRPRRIEAGLLNAGSDFDQTVTPFAAGLGQFVDLDKTDFVGKAALQAADKRPLTWGIRTCGGTMLRCASRSRTTAPASGNANSRSSAASPVPPRSSRKPIWRTSTPHGSRRSIATACGSTRSSTTLPITSS